MCGDRDPLVPVDQAAALARQVRDGRLFVAPDCRPRRHHTSSRTCARGAPGLLSFDRVERQRARRRASGGAPMTTLLALFRRPDGGAEAQATFERRYADGAPAARRGDARPARDAGPAGRRGARRRDATSSSSTTMRSTIERRSTPASPRTRCAPPAGTCARSPRASPPCSCSRTCRRWTRRRLPRAWILSGRQSRSARDRHRAMSDPAATRSQQRPSTSASRSRRPRRRRRRPRRRCRRRARDARPAAPRSTRSASTCSTQLASTRSRRSTAIRPAGPSSSPGPATRAFAAGADIRELAPQTRGSLTAGGRFRRLGPARRRSGCRSSPPSAASRSVAAASWR